MNENLNLTEILKDCPKGMKLYSPIFGDVYLDKIRPYLAIIVTINKGQDNFKEEFLYDGRYGINGECTLFPSKDQRDWSKWHSPFVKGDILVSEKGNIVLCSHIDEEQLVHYHCILNFWGNFEIYNGTGVGYSYNCNLANNSQKQRLFDALKKEGYEWDDTTKTLKKLIEPKFKDGDKIRLWTIQDAKEGDVLAINWYEGYDYWEKIIIFKKYHNEGANSPCVEGYGNTFKNRKLAFNDGVPYFSKTWTSCLEPATKEQRDFLFQTIKEAGYKWNPETKTLEKLKKEKSDIKTCLNCNTFKVMHQNCPYSPIWTCKDLNVAKSRLSDETNCEFWRGIPKIHILENNKFDPKTLQPFDKVIVRDFDNQKWMACLFSHIDNDSYHKFKTVAGLGGYQCIPFNNDTKHLVGKMDTAPEFYRYWKY